MPSEILVRAPDAGLNALLPDNIISPREAADGSQNILYELGLLKTPHGFAKLDLTAPGITSLNSGDAVLAVFPFREIDRYSHLIAVTTEKIYDHDRTNSTWSDKTQSGVTMSSDIFHPISYAEIAHDDTDIYIDDNTSKNKVYYHLLVCDGGLSNIQRWAGRWEADFGDVVGAGGYHDGTTHRALQVTSFRSRTILINPLEYSSSSLLWVENNQRVRWPTVGKLQTWTGTGSGFSDLLDTGGYNLWSARLGGQHIIYQTQGIWDLNYVGGTTVFDPKPAISDLGLLAWHLLIARSNVHYFIGTDYNVYAYYGGTVKQRIGDKIVAYLQRDLNPEYQNRCWMTMGPDNKRLWIFIVPNGSTYITKAYGMDIKTGAWMVRDFAHKWSTGGVTAVGLVGAETYTVGETYAQALGKVSLYNADVSKDTVGDVTQRYGDVLLDGTINALDWTSLDATLDFTDVEFSEGGLFFCFSASADPTKLVGDDTNYSGLIMKIDDGSDSTNMPYGSHFYTLTDISSVDGGGGDFTVRVNLAPRDTTGNAAADASTNTPALTADTSATLYDPSGATYRQKQEQVYTTSEIVLGDSDGIVYRFSDTATDDDGESMDCRHLTRIEDMDEPDKHKLWPGINIVAKEKTSGNGAILVSYRISNFDTSDTGWTGDFSQALTSDFEEHTFYFYTTSKRIQARFRDFSGSDFEIREFEWHRPLIEENR